MRRLAIILGAAGVVAGCQLVTGSFDVSSSAAGDGGSDGGAVDAADGSSGAGESGSDGATCGPAPGGGSCVVYPPCGCPPDQKCVRVNGSAESCVANGSVPALGDCVDDTNCQHGLVCSEGVCVPICAVDGGSCAVTSYVCVYQILLLRGRWERAAGIRSLHSTLQPGDAADRRPDACGMRLGAALRSQSQRTHVLQADHRNRHTGRGVRDRRVRPRLRVRCAVRPPPGVPEVLPLHRRRRLGLPGERALPPLRG